MALRPVKSNGANSITRFFPIISKPVYAQKPPAQIDLTKDDDNSNAAGPSLQGAYDDVAVDEVADSSEVREKEVQLQDKFNAKEKMVVLHIIALVSKCI